MDVVRQNQRTHLDKALKESQDLRTKYALSHGHARYQWFAWKWFDSLSYLDFSSLDVIVCHFIWAYMQSISNISINIAFTKFLKANAPWCVFFCVYISLDKVDIAKCLSALLQPKIGQACVLCKQVMRPDDMNSESSSPGRSSSVQFSPKPQKKVRAYKLIFTIIFDNDSDTGFTLYTYS